MLHYFKFRQDLFAPQVAKDIYVKRPAGQGWPEECPPIRTATGFGFDLLANFDLTFIKRRGGWRAEPDTIIDSDFEYSATEEGEGRPLTQQYAWFWQKGQTIPHKISDNVFPAISNQVKVSSFLFLRTDQNELLYMTDIPNIRRPWRTMTALVETDWYPASYPWHIVLELDPKEKRIKIPKGEPLCRVFSVRRDTYFAQQMTPAAFDDFFTRGQSWLTTHGHGEHETENGPMVDITHSYVRQQARSKFIVAG